MILSQQLSASLLFGLFYLLNLSHSEAAAIWMWLNIPPSLDVSSGWVLKFVPAMICKKTDALERLSPLPKRIFMKLSS